MEEIGYFSGFLGGLGGAVTAELIVWIRKRQELATRLPEYAKSPLYWILTLVMAALGGGLVCFHLWQGSSLTLILAFNIGLTFPLLLSKGAGGITSELGATD